MDHVQNLELLCLLLLDIFPDLDIRGVDYMNDKMLKGTKHEHLLEEMEKTLMEQERLVEQDGGPKEEQGEDSQKEEASAARKKEPPKEDRQKN